MATTNELAGFRADVKRVRMTLGSKDPAVALLCNTLEELMDPDTILLLAESILRERRICDVAFCDPSDACEEDVDYNHNGCEVAIIVMPLDENAPLIETQGHETLVHAYHTAPIFHTPQFH
jgi:hypothetical protein